LADVREVVDLPDTPRLVDDTIGLLEELAQGPMPLVFEHGDLSHPNLMLRADGRLGVVDWERSEPRGLPGHDVCFLLQYVSESQHAVFHREGQLRAFDDAFVGRSAWARPWLERYMRSLALPPEMLPHLIVMTFARSAAGLVGRVRPNHTRSHHEDRLTVADDRDFALWRHAVERFEHLVGGPGVG
jgi:hypothetical protein